MGNYSTYKVEDFLLDESFINWVINNSEKDAIFWTAWVAAHPTCVPTVNLAKKTLLALYVKPARQLTDNEIDSIIGRVTDRVEVSNKAKFKRFTGGVNVSFFSYPIAAVLVMGILLAAYFYNKLNITAINKEQTIAYAIKDHVNHTGAGMLIKLSDGSSVILAPGSKLRYPTYFKGNTRSVSLEGEAFFEVRKNAKRPFFVTSGNLVTRVVGTSFTIRAYNGTKEYKVIVNTGKVLVSQKANTKANSLRAKPIAVIPNQELIYNIAHKSLIKENLVKPLMLSANVSKDIFTFNDTPLSKVISRIERAYNVHIMYNEKEIGGCPLTASLGEEHLLEKLDLISKALDVKYYINDGQIVLQGTGCSK